MGRCNVRYYSILLNRYSVTFSRLGILYKKKTKGVTNIRRIGNKILILGFVFYQYLRYYY